MTCQHIGPDAPDFLFRHADRQRCQILCRNACILQLLEECDIAVSVERIEYDVGLRRFDFAYNCRVVRMAKRRIFFACKLAAFSLRLSAVL
jgi:hypothetical protein